MSDSTRTTDASPSRSTATGRNGSATTADGKAERRGTPLTPTHHAALAERGLIDVDMLTVRLGVTASELLGGRSSIAIPYFDEAEPVGRKHRTLEGTKRFAQDKGSAQIFYNIDALRDDTLITMPLVITEGELDCWAAMMSGVDRCVSVPGGAPMKEVEDSNPKKYGFIVHAESLLTKERAPDIVLACDDDINGRALRHDLLLRLGAARCRHVAYPPGCKDLNDVLRILGGDAVRACIFNAQPVEIEGWWRYADVELPPYFAALTTGIEGMDDHYKPRLGDFTVVTGIPGMGKSALVTELCGRMAMMHRWRSVMASFETPVKPDLARELRTFYAAKLERDMDDAELARADEWIDSHFSFILAGEPDVTLAWLLECAAQAILRFEAQCLVIDPWNEMDHLKGPDMTMTEYTGFAIKLLKKFARKYRVHLIVVAHPAKMQRGKDGKFPPPSLYDIADSAHWANKPDVGIVVHRDDPSTPNTLLRIAKVRYRAVGRPGDLAGVWDYATARYSIGPIEEVIGRGSR